MRPDELFSLLRPPLTTSELAKLRLGDSPFSYHGLVLEFAFWVVVLILTALLLWLRPAFFQRIEAYGKALGRKRGLVVASVILGALLIRIPLLIVMPYPEPVVHDEYSYLLQAATFASGRLTNPTPAGWEHLETFHVNMRPTYQSMYPPGQAMFLAAADIVHVHPWWGVWLSVGLMCGAVCWMLQAWVPPQWALLGGLFCVVRFASFSYWDNSYFGGAVAATGGALVFGSLPRLKRNQKVRYALLFALGLAILANTRAYEGFVLSVPAVIALGLWIVPAWKRGQLGIRPLAAGMAVLVAAGALTAYYNWRVTGHPLSAPYIVNQAQYHITKPFIWQTRYPIPNYRHQIMRTFYVFHELPDYLMRQDPQFLAKMLRFKIQVYYEFFIWPMMIPVIFALWITMKSRKLRILSVTVLVMLAGLLIEQWAPESHYAAPILAVAVAVVICGLRLMWTWRPKGIPLGPMVVRSAVLTVLALSLLAIGQTAFNPFQLAEEAKIVSPELERASLVSRLERIPGNHLVFVHLHLADRGSIFWIYNDPDLTKSKIIWAHDMGDAENRELMKLYPDRTVWFVDKDDAVDALVRYPDVAEVAGAAPRPNLENPGQAHAQ